jgi:S-(hydroxymethyl)glutathione dehydrogenase / alcohol dehydrogenase
VQAAVLAEFGAKLRLAELEVDRPWPDEVVVATAASGLCHSDRLAQAGQSPRARAVPVVLGHEVAGVVEAVGERVTGVRPGDPVVACAAASCGRCQWCARGQEQHCESMHRARPPGSPPRLSLAGVGVEAFVGIGGFASRLLLHERALVRIPATMPLDRAALLGCAVHTGFGAVRHSARVTLGQTVAVLGCGGVGLSIVQAARMAGATDIVAIDLNAAALARATAFGATATVDASRTNPAEMVAEIISGGCDHVFDVVGSPATVVQACAMARVRGTVTVVGLPRPGETVPVPSDVFFAEKRLQGSKMGRRFRLDIPWYCELYLAGRLRLDELISQRIPLAEVNAGLAALDGSDLARSVVVFLPDQAMAPAWRVSTAFSGSWDRGMWPTNRGGSPSASSVISLNPARSCETASAPSARASAAPTQNRGPTLKARWSRNGLRCGLRVFGSG